MSIFTNIYCLPIRYTVYYLLAATFAWRFIHQYIQYIGQIRVLRRICCVVLVLWGGAVLYSTVFARSPGVHEVSLLPFQQIYTVLDGGNPEILRSAWMNVLLFVPGGLLLSEAMFEDMEERKRVITVMIMAMVFSGVIELTQGIGGIGVMETDDVICNAFGAWVGYMIYRLGRLQFLKK